MSIRNKLDNESALRHAQYDEACVEIASECRRDIAAGIEVLENRALLSLVSGNSTETKRLTVLLKRRNELGIRVVTSISEQPSPAQ